MSHASRIQARINFNLKNACILHAQLLEAIAVRLTADIESKKGQLLKSQPKGYSPEFDFMKAWATRDSDGAIRQIAALGKAFNFENFVQNLANIEGKCPKEKFIAVKTAVKCLDFVSAIFSGQGQKATVYCVLVMRAALKNNGILSMNETLGSLSRKVVVPAESHLTRDDRGGYTPGTAGAQGSQIRMLAHAFKFAEVNKGARNDVMRIHEKFIPELCEVFGVNQGESLTADEVEALTTE
jgi:hypothetical protein